MHYLLALGAVQLILSAHMVLTLKDLCARMKAKVRRYRDLGVYSISVVLITAAAAGRTGDGSTVVCTLERDFGCIEDLGGALVTMRFLRAYEYLCLTFCIIFIISSRFCWFLTELSQYLLLFGQCLDVNI